MKTFTTNKILVEVSAEELEILLKLLNQLQVFHLEKLKSNISEDYRSYYTKCTNEASTLWHEIYKIQQELPF